MTTDDFIRVYDGLFDEEYCSEVIKQFEFADKSGFSYDRQKYSAQPKTAISDTSIALNDFCQTEFEYGVVPHSNKFADILWNVVYERYAAEFPYIRELDRHYVKYIKVQRTRPGEGYHVWHAECQGRKDSDRVLVFILYLNDIEEGGETEFLYQHKRVSPKTGRILIFPSAFTHLHRGNPPLKGDKYIITGWVEYA